MPFEDLSTFINMGVGKYVTYRLDSLKFVQFGQRDTIISYQAKDVIDAAITDNLGRPSWRVIRYLNDTLALGTWNPDITYIITPTRETLEVVENNLRFIKLKIPIREAFNWKGNKYIDTKVDPNVDPNWPYNFLDDWDYTYANVDQPNKPFSITVPVTITVNQHDETLGTINNVDAYSERIYSQEVYGKGIGLIYKSFIRWIFQPRTSTYPSGYKDGYAITLRMIDHN